MPSKLRKRILNQLKTYSVILLLICLSTVLLFFSFPAISFSVLVFVFFVPFIYCLEKADSCRQGFVAGGMFGLLWIVFMGYWLYPSLVHQYEKTPFMAIVFIMISGVVPMGILFGVLGAVIKYFQSRYLFFFAGVVPSLWVMSDYIKEIVPVMVPWGSIGYAVLPLKNVVQIADIVGIYGLAYWVVMINCLIYWLLKEGFELVAVKPGSGPKKATFGIVLCFLVCVFVVPVLYGKKQNRIYSSTANEANGILVKVVQGNFNQKDRWSGMGFYYRIKTYLKLSKKEDADESLIVWPETVLNSSGKNSEVLFREIVDTIGSDKALIVGGIRAHEKESGLFNSAFLLSQEEGVSWYDKSILLPYAEFKPVGDMLGSYYNAPSEFLKGEGVPVMKTRGRIAGISICLEALYPWYIRKSVNMGAHFLVNISNDTWFGKSAMPKIHLMASRLRAIENRRYLVRASNSGISAIISPTGSLVASTELFKRDTLSERIFPSTDQSTYSKYGDWPVLVSMIILLGSFIRKLF
jgi:apolipoprotein N-acyltransferase